MAARLRLALIFGAVVMVLAAVAVAEPGLNSVSISCTVDDPAYARVGNPVRVALVGDENLQSVSATIRGQVASVSGSGVSWTAEYVMQAGDPEGVVPFTLDFAAVSDGTWGTTVTSTTDGTSVLFDKTGPEVPGTLSPPDGTLTNSPVISWSEPFDPGGSGIDNYRVQITGATTRSHYTSSLIYSPSLNDGLHQWTIYARDRAGNVGTVSASRDLTVDATDPQIHSITSGTADGRYGVGASINVTVTFTEAVSMATGTLDIQLDTGAVVSVLPFATSTTAGTTYVVGAGESSSDLHVDSVWMSGSAYLRDQAGNETNSIGVPPTNIDTGSDIVIETDPPGVESLTASPTLIGAAHVGDEKFLLTIDFDEDMIDFPADEDEDSPLTIAFPSEDPTGTIAFDAVASKWVAADIYDAYYDVADNDALLENVDVRVTGAEDLAGNPMGQHDEADAFGIDLANPTVDSVTADPTFFADDGGTLEIEVAFSEAMDPAQPPNFVFSPDVTSTVSVGAGSWNAPDNDTYTATCSISDRGEAESGVTVDVIDALDANGNPQTDYMPQSEFSFDMENPSVDDVTVSDTMVSELDLGTGTFTVTVDFDEAMDEGTDPTILFNPSVATTLTLNAELSEWTDGDTYSAVYDVADAGVEVSGVLVDVEDAKDAAGNVQEDYVEDPEFNIDTLNPTVTAVFVDTDPIYDGDLTQKVTVDYDESMDMLVKPTVEIMGIKTSKSDSTSGSWNGNMQYIVTITLDDDDEDDSSLDVVVSGAEDAAGNTQEPHTESDPFTVDTLNPTITSITSATADAYYNSGAIDITVTFSENVTLSGGTLDITLDTPSDIVSFTGFSSWPDASANYSIGTGDNSCDLDAIGVSLSGASLRDDAGNDGAVSLPGTTIADGSDIAVDTTDPMITWASEFPDTTQDMDGDCSLTFPIDVRVTDNCGILVDGVTFSLSDSGNVTVTDTLTKAQHGDTRVDIAGNVTLTNSNGGTATATLDVSAIDRAGNVSADDGTVTVEDTTAPSISGFNLPDGTLYVSADTCSFTVVYYALVSDNCCLDGSNVSVDIEFVAPYDTAQLSAPTPAIENVFGTPVKQVTINGAFTVNALTDDPVHVRVKINATDCNGNVMTEVSDTAVFEDGANPTISWNTDLPASPQYVSSDTCSITLPIQATVSDACCIDDEDVVVSILVTNATLSHNVAASQDPLNQCEVDVSGDITVSALTGCPAVLSVTIDASDCAGNTATQLGDTVSIYDDTIPVIRDLVVEQHIVVNDCCEADVDFSAYVTDQCCITPTGITIVPTNPTDDLTIDFDQARDVTITQNGQGRVDISGVVPVRCVTSCPAIVKVRIEAIDCCGNDATPVESTADPGDVNETGHVFDETDPIARDDPRQDMAMDESAIRDGSLVEVRLDEFSIYRLVFRASSPERIDVLANDADNCSCEDCAHPFDPCGTCDDCQGCCGELTIDAIVDEPDYGTATIEDAVGDCQGGSVIRYAPDHGYLGPDSFEYTIRDVCGNVSAPVAVYVQMVEETVMEDVAVTTCSGQPVEFTVTAADLWVDRDPVRIPFAFSIVSGPTHGVLTGDPSAMALSPASLGADPSTGVPVPTLDFTEAATIELVYTPAEGFVGRDVLMVRFEDPFGAFATARVDLLVIDCPASDVLEPTIFVEEAVVLPIILPVSFAEAAAFDPGLAVLLSTESGMPCPDSLSIVWSEDLDRYLLLLDAGSVPAGVYRLTIPFGNGERVELVIEVGKAE